MRPQELRDSVAFAAGVSYERRRMGELLRQRAALLAHMPGSTPRTVVTELRRLALEIEKERLD